MKTALKAISLAHVPHIAVKTWLRPFGATFIKESSTNDGQLAFGSTPKAGLLINALTHSSDLAAFNNSGLLYPMA
jgi:hypothetical protein